MEIYSGMSSSTYVLYVLRVLKGIYPTSNPSNLYPTKTKKKSGTQPAVIGNLVENEIRPLRVFEHYDIVGLHK